MHASLRTHKTRWRRPRTRQTVKGKQLARGQGHCGAKGPVSWTHQRNTGKVRAGWTLHKRREPRMERLGLVSSLPSDGS